MAKVFDIRLEPYADQLTAIIGGHTALQQEYEEDRRVFNAHFRKVMTTQISPHILDLLTMASRRGHMVEVHSLMDERYRVYVHQCYSIHGVAGGKADIAIVANYDYKKIFVILEMAEKTHQVDFSMHQVTGRGVLDWLFSLLPTL